MNHTVFCVLYKHQSSQEPGEGVGLLLLTTVHNGRSRGPGGWPASPPAAPWRPLMEGGVAPECFLIHKAELVSFSLRVTLGAL